jgi:hypothetical protein
MDTRRTVLVGLVLFCALGGTAAFAAPMCQSGTLASYLGAGFTCTEDNGILSFKDFAYTPPEGGLSAAQITVSPLDMPGSVGFLFTGSFASINGTSTAYVFSYFIDPPPIIHGEQMDLDPMASVILQLDLCSTPFNPGCGGTPLGTLTADNSNPPSSLKASTQLANTNALGVRNTLTLTGAGTSQGFDNITSITPEPSSILLAASGLLGLLAFRWRAKLRKIRFQ